MPGEPPRAAERLTQAELDRVLVRHEMFYAGRPGGRRAQLRGAKLGGLKLARRDLHEADPSRARLDNADLRGADLGVLRLGGEMVRATSLDRASLRSADLRGADLRRATLRDAELARALCQEARFDGCDLSLARTADALGLPRPSH